MSWSSETIATVLSLVLGSVVLGTACAPSASGRYDRVERHAFNRAAVRLNLPLLWVAEHEGNGAVEPGEVVSLLFYPEELAARLVDSDAVPQKLISERMVRHPKASFVYALDM